MTNPVSLQSAISKFSPYRPLGVGVLARKLGMAAPVSVLNIAEKLTAMPTEKSFGQQVVTPEGTPLGGSVTLNVKSDGTYTIEFVMHSSSDFAAFDFQLRAYLAAPGLPAFFFYHAGHVSPIGTDTAPESGSNPLIEMYWNQIATAGTFSVARDYSWAGVAGGIASLVSDLVDLGAAAVGAALGAVVGLTREAIGWLGATLGPGGTFGVIAGIVVFAVGAVAGLGVGSALILGVVAGAAAGAITNAMIKYRPMSAPEITFARTVFNSELPFADVIFTNLAGLGGRAFTAPGVDGKTYCNLGEHWNDTDVTVAAGNGSYPQPGELMIHELTHAWQIAHNSFVPGFMCSGMVNQANYVMGDNVYAYGPPGPQWSSFNLEQQGQIVNQWFGGDGTQGQWGKMNTASPYYRYISDNILTGSGGFSTSWL